MNARLPACLQMPALVLFGRRWLLASDDVPLPAAACALFHGVRSCESDLQLHRRAPQLPH